MKKVILSVAVAGAFLAPQAFAQSKNFEGFSLGLSANFNNAKMEGYGISPSDNSTTAGIKAAYGWALGTSAILSLGASYDTGKAKVFSGSGYELYGQDTTILSIEPGFKMAPNVLGYLKLGYATLKGVGTYQTITAKDNYTGTAYGLGVRGMLAKNWSADLEFLQADFSSKDGVKPSGSVTSIGVNYHF
jgi:opacity protein-like surface antigen